MWNAIKVLKCNIFHLSYTSLVDEVTCNILMVSVFQVLWNVIPNYCDFTITQEVPRWIFRQLMRDTSFPNTFIRCSSSRLIFWIVYIGNIWHVWRTLHYAAYEMYGYYAINLFDYLIDENRLLQWSLFVNI